MEKNRVRLNICGADYTITTEDDPKYVMALGDELDAALTKTLRENNRLSVTQAAILAALEYADMYKKAEISADNLRSQIKEYLEDTYHLEFVTLDRKEYMNHGQLNTIKDQMELCAGAVVFAFSYLNVEGDKSGKVKSYTSPWIQIEAAFASSLKLPTLIVMGNGVECDGIFDDKITSQDSLLYKFFYSGGLTESNYDVIEDWCFRVERTSPNLSRSSIDYDIVPDLSDSIHEFCVRRRIDDGWNYGKEFDDVLKTDPSLVPFEELPDEERAIRHTAAKEAVKIMMKTR